MSKPRRNRQQRFVRAVVYVLVLALVIGLIATMVGTALASPAPRLPSAAGAAVTTSSPAPAGRGAAPAARGAAPAQLAEPGHRRAPVVVLGTVDLTWADLLAAADSTDVSLAAAAKVLLAYADGGQPVNLVTRTVGERTCPADGWLTLGAGSRVRAAERSGDGAAGCRWPAYWTEAAGATGSTGEATARAGALAGFLARAGATTAAVGRGGALALTYDGAGPAVGGSPGELLAREDPPDLIIADTVPQAAGTADTADLASSDAERILALADALEPLADAPAGTRVVVASVADATDPGPQLAILPPGTISPLGANDPFLVGASTHRRGLIQLTDLAPSLALAVTGQTPGSFWSQPLDMAHEYRDSLGGARSVLGNGNPVNGTSRARALADDALHARASRRATVPTGLALIGAALALGLAAARVLRSPRDAVSDGPQDAVGGERPRPGTGPAAPDARPATEAGTGAAAGAAPPVNEAAPPEAEPSAGPATGAALPDAQTAPPIAEPALAEAPRTGPSPTRLRALAWAACLVAMLPAGLWLANGVPWWRAGGAATPVALGTGLAFAAGFVVVTAALARAALALTERLRPQAAQRLLAELGLAGADPGPVTPRGLGALVSVQMLVVLPAGMILTDAAQGAPLAFNGPLGMNAVVAGRFYGVSNTAFALAAASLLVAIAAWAGPLVATRSGSRERQRALTVALVAGFGAAALAVDAAPNMGADVGGALALVPALVALGAGLAGVRLGWWRWVAVGAGAVGVVLLLGLGDFLICGSSTHLGRFFGRLLTGTAGPTLMRKATALVAPFGTSWFALAGLVVGAGAAALVARAARRAVHEARRGRGPYAWLARPGALPGWLGPLGRALAVLVVVEVLVNDSGLTMLCFSAAAAAPALTAVLAARLAAASAAPAGPPAPAVLPAPAGPSPSSPPPNDQDAGPSQA